MYNSEIIDCLRTLPLQRFNLYMREKFFYLRHQKRIIHRTFHFKSKIKSRLKNNIYYHFYNLKVCVAISNFVFVLN